ncbi:hypothetical protein H4Q26_015402 [Puccinia striiformis f. sp. tritici PST-130]|nr:hypothetical protein H4Q26_015402 [Puccinia striiformis f. sp. tritici PST-130]
MGYIVYDRVEGTKIEWKEGKDLIRERVIKPKKQRNQECRVESSCQESRPPPPPRFDDLSSNNECKQQWARPCSIKHQKCMDHWFRFSPDTPKLELLLFSSLAWRNHCPPPPSLTTNHLCSRTYPSPINYRYLYFFTKLTSSYVPRLHHSSYLSSSDGMWFGTLCPASKTDLSNQVSTSDKVASFDVNPDDEISMFGENIQIHRNRGDQQDWFQDLVDLSFSADSRLMASL